MSRIEVEGMQTLQGEVTVQGSKNAVLPILSACVLNEGETVLSNCPRLKDVFSMLDTLSLAGAKIRWEGSTLYINTSAMQPVSLTKNAGETRSSIILLGSFLARFGKAVIGYPGGCSIGKRPIDLHEQTLEAMGAVFCEREEYLEADAKHLEGCDIYLPYPSVGVTENLILAASGASGMTRIYGAAREPEIIELCRFLTEMGMRIYGIGTENLFIMCGERKKYVEYRICTDRIVAGTYLLAVAAAGGDVIVKDAPLEHMRSTIQILGKMGAKLHRSGMDVKISMKNRPETVPFLRTAPYPGFPTDLQSPLLASLCMAKGKSRIEENVFENRFLIVEELKKMGAEIAVKDRTAFISSVQKMKGNTVCVKDLRGGAALVIAALEAEGKSKIENAEIIFRGYENIVEDLCQIGGKLYFSEDEK